MTNGRQPARKGTVAGLRLELAATKRKLSRASREVRDLREELVSSNEELQSTNEGLETSREELQSMNEELAVVNAQLLEKIAEVTRSSDDLTSLLTSSSIAMVLLDSKLRVSRFTAPSTAVFALQDSDIGRPIAELRMLAEYPGFVEDAGTVLEGGAPIEKQIHTPSAQAFMARLVPYRSNGTARAGVVATFVDVSSLNLARTALRENDEQLRALIDHVAVGIAITDLRGRILDVNPALTTMLGWERQILLGRSLSRHAHQADPAEPAPHRDLLAGRRQHYDVETRYLRSDGNELWARVSVSLVRTATAPRPRVVYVIQDVSDAKRSEVRLRAQEGLARLGEMAAAIAHEVRSPLVAVRAAVEVLATRLPGDAAEIRVVGEIRQRIGAVDALVSELLLFARPRDVQFAQVSILRLLEDVGAAQRGSGDLGEVDIRVFGCDSTVLGDAALLKSVFVNLTNNAAQAMNGRGELRIQLETELESVQIAFTDTGPGVPAALTQRIFEPFFTTRTKGIGLGLSLARQIIEAHGGDIVLLPPQGSGTTLLVTLPRANDDTPPARLAPAASR